MESRTPPIPTLLEMVENMRENVTRSARCRQDGIDRLARPLRDTEDDRRGRAEALLKVRSDSGNQRHWREYASHYEWIFARHPELADVDFRTADRLHGHQVPPPDQRHRFEPARGRMPYPEDNVDAA